MSRPLPSSFVCHWQVLNDPGKAEELLQQADDVDAAAAVDLADRSSQLLMFQAGNALDTTRDDLAVVTVSQSLASIGVIETANSVALSLFGYNKRDMVGKNVSLIIPAPFSGMHDVYMRHYVATGMSVSVWCTGLESEGTDLETKRRGIDSHWHCASR